MIFSFLAHINLSRAIPAKFKMQLQKSKLLLVTAVAALVFSSCDKIPSGVVDSKIVDYSVTNIVSPKSVTYNPADSSVTTSIQFANTGSIGSVWCKISFLDGTAVIKDNNTMSDDGQNGDAKAGDGIYTAKFLMSKKNPVGVYQIEYFVTDNVNLPPNNSAKVGAIFFSYDNNQNNVPPVISNLSMPSSVSRGSDFSFSLKAEDPNGASDIQSIFYKLYRPDGTLVINSQGISEFPLYDDGNSTVHGDQTAGDGIYSAMLNFPATQPTGVWKFEFQAKDRGGMTSNMITQNLTVN